jgi:hypothetical protein
MAEFALITVTADSLATITVLSAVIVITVPSAIVITVVPEVSY